MPTPDARPPLWTRLFTALTIANFCVASIFYILTSTLSGWALSELGASQSQAGLVGTAWFIGAMVARVVSGRILTLAGERLTVLGSLGLMLVGGLAYFACSSVEALVVLRFLHGIGFGLTATALGAATLAKVPITRRGEGSGWFTFGMAIAAGLAPMLGNFLQGGPLGQRGVFVAALGCAVVSLVLAGLVAGQLQPRRPRERGHGFRLSDYLDLTVLPIAVTVGLCAMPFGAILTLLAPYAGQMGMAQAVGPYFLAYAMVVAVSRPAAGILQDRHGDTSVMLPIICLLIGGVAATALAGNTWGIVAAGALLGLGHGTLIPAGQTVALNLVGSSRAGIGVASYFLFVDAGTGLGPFVLGSLVEPLGYRGAFLTGLAFPLVGLLSMLLLRRRLSAAAR
ncbi:MAG: MFS transporter [Luteococcus sp.]|uniref:MFS transporter n=1 Tax=Luteococcus sp. TaxID=1969402 RepID=UPI00264A2D0B|nr:MFS transporter [Luteococcus sp.]MDN5564390.1 MFS transporter [Luteococcus sp.]